MVLVLDSILYKISDILDLVSGIKIFVNSSH